MSDSETRTKEALKLSEEQFRRAIEDAPIPTIMQTEDGQVILLSHSWTELTGYKLSDMPTFDNWVTNAVYDGAENVRNHMHELFKGNKKSINIEFTVRTHSKGIRDWSFSASSPGTLLDGRRFVIGMAVDVTERKKAEEEVARIASFPTNNPNPIVEADFEGKITYLNPAAKRTIADIEAKGSAHPFLVDWQNVVRTLKTKSDSSFSREVGVFDHWYLQTIHSVEEGECIRVYSVDITKRKKAEDALIESEQRFKLAQQVAHVGTFEWNIQTGVNKWTPELEAMYGLPAGGFPGTQDAWEQLVYPEDRNEAVKRVSEAIEKGFFEGEWRVVWPDGSIHWMFGRGWVFKDSAGKPLRLLGINLDITDRKKNEESLKYSEQAAIKNANALKTVQEKLEVKTVETEQYATKMESLATERAQKLQDAERLAAIGATAGMVGHDIRNPLQAITGDIYIVNSGLSELPDSSQKAEMKESMDSITANVGYINKIVADLQDYARPLKPEYTIFDLTKLIDDALRAIVFPDNIKLSIDEKSIPAIKSDQTYLRRSITNLVNNAIQAMPDGGTVALKCEAKEGRVQVSISDTGVGIPEHVKERLFTPMMTTKSKGQGLGLAVVKRLIEALKGSITFESQEGKGTKFTIELPISTSA